MIDGNFFEGLNNLQFDTETDTSTAIDFNAERKIINLYVVVCVISFFMVVIMMVI